MQNTVVHCFDDNQAAAEGRIIGSILAGYGELELEMTLCLIAATGDSDASIQALFQEQGEAKRINKADKLMKTTYRTAGLSTPYKQAISDMHWCRLIRNQYAHCHWLVPPGTKSLFFRRFGLSGQTQPTHRGSRQSQKANRHNAFNDANGLLRIS